MIKFVNTNNIPTIKNFGRRGNPRRPSLNCCYDIISENSINYYHKKYLNGL